MSFHTTVRLAKYAFADSQFTVNLDSAITTAHVGLALAQDTTANNKAKLAGDGDEIIGIVGTVEDRINEGVKVGMVEFRFAARLAIKAALSGAKIVAVGSRLCGAGAGEVRAIDVATDTTPYKSYATAPTVWEVNGLVATALKL